MGLFKSKNRADQYTNDYFSTTLSSSNYNLIINEKQAMQLPVFKSCMSLIENTIAALPIKMKEKQGNNIEYVTNNQYLMMLNNPNSIDTVANLKKKLVHELLLYGRAYLYVNHNHLHVLKSKLVTEEYYSESGFTIDEISYKYDFEGTHILESKNVIRFDFGEGILKSSDVLETAINAQNLNKTMLEKGTYLTGILKAGTRLTDKAIKSLRESWQNLYSGAEKNKTVILEEGLDYQPISMSADQLQLKDTDKALISKVCMLFNISESLISDSSSKYDSLAVANTNFFQKTISPLLNEIESTLNKHFFDDERLLFVFDISQVLKATEIENIEATKLLFDDGLISFNEARTRINYNVIDDDGNYYKHSIGEALRNEKTGKILNINTQQTNLSVEPSSESNKNNTTDDTETINQIKEKEVV